MTTNEQQQLQQNFNRSRPTSAESDLPLALGAITSAIQDLRNSAIRHLPPRLSMNVDYSGTDPVISIVDERTGRRGTLAITWEDPA